MYLGVRRHWREAGIGIVVGLTILLVSYGLDPGAWAQFKEITLARSALDESGFVGIPYAVRFLVGCGFVVVAALLTSRRAGEALLVVAVTIALPTLWFTALSTLSALYLVLRPTRVSAT